MCEEKKFQANRVQLSFPSDPKFLNVARAVVSLTAERAGFSREEIDNIALAVDEACTNVIKHAYKRDPTKEIILTCSLADSRMEVLIRDFGAKADPATFKSRKLEEVRPGGLGVYFIKKIMDTVEYDNRSFAQGTQLKLVKFKK
jgi:anti-sigma regulatory factor (Ser/Thr protein kinase)